MIRPAAGIESDRRRAEIDQPAAPRRSRRSRAVRPGRTKSARPCRKSRSGSAPASPRARRWSASATDRALLVASGSAKAASASAQTAQRGTRNGRLGAMKVPVSGSVGPSSARRTDRWEAREERRSAARRRRDCDRSCRTARCRSSRSRPSIRLPTIAPGTLPTPPMTCATMPFSVAWKLMPDRCGCNTCRPGGR